MATRLGWASLAPIADGTPYPIHPTVGPKKVSGTLNSWYLWTHRAKLPASTVWTVSLGSVVFMSSITFSIDTWLVGRSGGVAHSCCTLRYSSIHPWRPGLGGGAGYSRAADSASLISATIPMVGRRFCPITSSAGSIWIRVWSGRGRVQPAVVD